MRSRRGRRRDAAARLERALEREAHVADVAERAASDPSAGTRCSSATQRRRDVAAAALQSGSLRTTARERVGDVVAGERARARQHLVEHGAERPDVGALVDGLAPRLLGRHVGGGAEDHARLRHRGRRDRRRVRRRSPSLSPGPRPASIAFARPKSSTFTVPSGAHLDVGGLQVAMDDALLVRGFERLGDLLRDRQRLVERNRRRARCAATGPRPRPVPSPARVHRRTTSRSRRSRRCAG